MNKVWWCGQDKKVTNRVPWRWGGMSVFICASCMREIGGTGPQCAGRWVNE